VAAKIVGPGETSAAQLAASETSALTQLGEGGAASRPRWNLRQDSALPSPVSSGAVVHVCTGGVSYEKNGSSDRHPNDSAVATYVIFTET
jgi:hypothetical protein